MATESYNVGSIGFAIATLLATWGTVRGFRELRAAPANRGWLVVAGQLLGLFGNFAMVAIGALLAFVTTMGFVRGRQLRRLGKVLLPPIVPGSSWANTKVTVTSDQPIPNGLAEQWRQNGRSEHASVAAFARVTLDLMALGAPPRLLADANADAIDEIRHTELCFSLARSLDGKSEDPGPFPEASRVRPGPASRVMGLSALAVHSLIDGALHEGVSARVVAKLAKRCEVPAIRGVLKERSRPTKGVMPHTAGTSSSGATRSAEIPWPRRSGERSRRCPTS